MMQGHVNLQVLVKKSVITKSKKKAEEYGFSNVAEMVRFFLNGVNQGKITPGFEVDDEYLTPAEEARLMQLQAEAEDDLRNGTAIVINSRDDLKKLFDE